MWSLLKKVMTLVSQFGVTLEDLMEIFNLLMDIKRPPAISDEESFRDWLCSVLHIFIAMAEKTPTTVDDTALKMFDRAVEDDSTWALVYRLMSLVFVRDSNLRKFSANSYDFVVPGTMSEMAIARDIVSAVSPVADNEEQLFVRGAVGDVDPGTIVTIAATIYEIGQYVSGAPLSAAEIDRSEKELAPPPEVKKPAKKKKKTDE